MREQIKAYYADKKIFWRIVAIAIVVLFIVFQVSGHKDWVDIAASNKISFAGEEMPTAGRYQLNVERFDREVALLEINAAQFIMIYKRWNLIMPTIEKQLKKAGLPDDLKYIPVIESALRDNVSSSAGAAGLWQFMPDTARSKWLIVDDMVDERFDVAKSTAAATIHLKNLYSKFHNRTLVAAAYNRGTNWLQRSIDAQYSNNFYDLWLNNETSRYVFRLVSMKYVREHRYQLFDHKTLGSMYTPFATKKISAKNIEDLAARAKKNNFSYYEIKKLNPWIKWNTLPEGKRNIEVFTSDK